jgi:hypothetical protein
VSRIRDYCEQIVVTALACPHVRRVERVRQEEDATGQIGFMRYRLTLSNGDLLELTERLEVQAGALVVTKYRHHWQDHAGRLIKRWDNAPHHPHVASFPDHLHDGAEEQVREHPPVEALHILTLVTQSLRPSSAV